ncbi:TRAFAC clade GTPase domain-containing protein [Microbacterium sp. Marseille-Q6965]|uniref:TRAFAC clade GTPase domain-containing protein n=1 Tax=Microbacterium sp. Marseille-Q6965 TaxID=2965072 RepID=UPI0021B7F0ED|nr:ATP/GTP-binding protein [Microbacterium sp. Marseille-Q6965]
MAPHKKSREQHIAVFGASGSGKTVMLSSFYGAAQEPQFLEDSIFRIEPESIGQGNALHQNYLGMKNEAQVPLATRFSAKSYAFNLRLNEEFAAKAAKGSSDLLKLVWHDYPGEWFEQDVTGESEAKRRVAAFRALLQSDVALVLVDGQKLRDHQGQERVYLKSLLTSLRTGLLVLKGNLLDEGAPLAEFPRIWMLALSKADVLPDMDVVRFRDLLIQNVAGEIEQLRKALAEFVQAEQVLSVGEDFVLLSSARFDASKIEVTERIGLDLILPIAAALPLERKLRWEQAVGIPTKVAASLADGAGRLAGFLLGKVNLPGPLGKAVSLLGPALTELASVGGAALKRYHEDALAKRDYVRALLSGFRVDLQKSEEGKVLIRSKR